MMSIGTSTGDSFTFSILGILVMLGPLMFLPFRLMPVAVGKGYLIALLGVILVIGAVFKVIRRGEVALPRKWIFAVLALLSITALAGSLLAPAFGWSFLGYGFETTTWFFITLFGLLIMFAFQAVRSFERIGILYVGMFASFFVVALWHILRYTVGSAFGSFGVLTTSVSTPVGAWSDLSLFAAFIALLSVLTLELAPFKKGVRWVMGVLGLVATFFVIALNNTSLLITFGFVLLLVSMYLFAFAYWDRDAQAYKKKQRVPWYSFTLFIIILVAIFFGGSLNRVLGKHQSLSAPEIRPSVSATIGAAGVAVVHNPATGYGPNTFGGMWTKIKPTALSASTLGSTVFTAGSGYVPTLMASNGLSGMIGWVAFFVLLLVAIIRTLARGFTHPAERYVIVSLGISVLFLSVMTWVMVPGIFLISLLAILSGSFFGLTFKAGDEKIFSFLKDPRTSFFGILLSTALLVAVIIAGYVMVRKTVSFVHYSKGMILSATKDGQVNGLNEFNRAVSLAGHDAYRVVFAQAILSQVASTVAGATADNKSVVSQKVEQLFGSALAQAQAAVAYNPTDYRNYIALASVYQSMVSVGVTEAAGKATEALQKAQALNPHDATLWLSFAQLALAQKDTAKALGFIKQSLDQYPTKDAYALRAQVEIGQQQWSNAVMSLKQVLAFDATDAWSAVLLGVVYERAGDTVNAGKIFDAIRNRFSDGDEVIKRVRDGLQASAPQAPVVPEVKKVAPTPKKK